MYMGGVLCIAVLKVNMVIFCAQYFLLSQLKTQTRKILKINLLNFFKLLITKDFCHLLSECSV